MDLLRKFKNYRKLNKKNLKAIFVFCFLILIFLRYDFSYNILPHKVKQNETLWSILEEKVFHSSSITGISIYHLKAQYPQFNWDHIEKNENGEGGYKIYVLLNKISIKASNNHFIVRNAYILPQVAVRNHILEIVTYDLLVISLAFFIFTNLTENNFRLGLGLLKDTIFIPGLLAIGGLIIMITAVLFLYLLSILNYYFFTPYQVIITPERVIYQK